MDLSDPLHAARLVLLAFVTVACCATDLRKRRIPNAILAPALLAACFISAVAGGLAGLLESLGGLLIGICMLLPLHVLGHMGAGDVKMMGVVGSILGTWGAVVAGLATMMAGAILGLTYLVWLFVQPGLLAWMPSFVKSSSAMQRRVAVPARTAEIPYAIAITAGACAALLYLNLLAGVVGA